MQKVTPSKQALLVVGLLLLSIFLLVSCVVQDVGVAVPTQTAEGTAVESAATVDPFANSNNPTPPAEVYSGPLFELSYQYPQAQPTPPSDPPWIQALDGQPISQDNAIAYVNALKDYVSDDMRTVLYDYENWNATEAGWYNQPWLGDIRESIHGTYVGSSFPAATFIESGLTTTMTTFVLTYYDEIAGYTVGQVWGDTAMEPALQNNEAQFAEGAVIVKFAFTTASGEAWPVMEGAASWPVYIDVEADGSADGNFELSDVYLMQFDIIVKDTQTAPETGWVFSTLVFDNRVEGDAWDQMIPLGAMWGNDPDVNSAQNPDAPLAETVMNPAAPEYSTATLGWGGRLSGPNDGAVAAPASINGETIASVPASSCMSCHGPAEYTLNSFLLPSPSDPPGSDRPTVTAEGALVLYEPGSEDWMRWFQDRPGTEPQDEGQIALDYDMVFAFKSFPAWQAATDESGQLKTLEEAKPRRYHGR